MKDDFAPRVTIPLPSGMTVTKPEELPVLVHFDDPATTVFLDYSHEHPVTISPDAHIDQALVKMKHSGIGILLVTDDEEHLLGEIIADGIMGEQPVRFAQSSGVEHADITVRMMMRPAARIRVLEVEHMHDARVGHIIATLHALETRYLLVADHGSIRGLFSAASISKQLNRSIMDEEVAAHSLAEMVHILG